MRPHFPLAGSSLLLAIVAVFDPGLRASETGREAAGWWHAVVVEENGEVLAFGDGRRGQLGGGDFATSRVPVRVVGPNGGGRLSGVAAVSARQHHTLALGEDGRVWAWGDNTFGQLGNGEWGMKAHSPVPVRVTGPGGEGDLEDVVAVAAGWDHSVALLEDGTVWAWGSRSQGQVGDGVRDPNSWSTYPVRVASSGGDGVLRGVTALASGAFHTVALLEDGTLYSWGGDHEGQLGHGGDGKRTDGSGMAVAWTPDRSGEWKIALGYTYTDPSHRDVADCVALVDDFDGTLVVGSTADGETSGEETRQTVRSERDAKQVKVRAKLSYPRSIARGERVVLDLEEVLAGASLTDDDIAEELYLRLTHIESGETEILRIGDLPGPVVGPGGDGELENIAAIAAGVYHTVALDRDGQVWGWGYNSTGQLGNGTRDHTSIPGKMNLTDGDDNPLGKIVLVAAGYENTYLVNEEGDAWAVGWNVYGQLGAAEVASSSNGHTNFQPVLAANGGERAPIEDLSSISSGAYFVIARNAEGNLLGWGHNGFGQLADGTVMDRDVAVRSAALEGGFKAPPERIPLRQAPPPPKVALHFAELSAEEGQLALNVLEGGAVGDGVHLDQKALQDAIDTVHGDGGGIVHLPAGTYRSGTLVMRDGVRLHLDEGATLLASTNRDHYSRNAVILAEGVADIAITGRGTIDGQGHFCPNRGWRHSIFRIHDSRNVTVEGVSTLNAGSWTQNYAAIEGLTIRGVTVNSVRPRRNNDGIDMSGCEDVLVEGCIVVSEDDAIVIKSQSAKRVNRNIRVINNTIYTMCNGFKFGTETRGDYENIVCDDLRAYGGSTLAIWSVDGSRVDGLEISNVQASDSRFAIGIALGARLGEPYFDEGEERVPGSVENVTLRNIDIEMSDRSFRDVLLDHGVPNAEIAHQLMARPAVESFVSGLPEHPVRNILFENVRLSYPGGGAEEDASIDVPLRETAYPNAAMFGTLPAWGFYLRNAENITFRNLQLELQSPDGRPALRNENLADDDLTLENLSVREAWKDR